MANPFEDPDGTYLVLVNENEQYSLWPSFALVPEGWSVALAETDRDTCLGFVEKNWTDLRPRSLREAMNRQDVAADGEARRA